MQQLEVSRRVMADSIRAGIVYTARTQEIMRAFTWLAGCREGQCVAFAIPDGIGLSGHREFPTAEMLIDYCIEQAPLAQWVAVSQAQRDERGTQLLENSPLNSQRRHVILG